jgi:hypothetical protein
MNQRNIQSNNQPIRFGIGCRGSRALRSSSFIFAFAGRMVAQPQISNHKGGGDPKFPPQAWKLASGMILEILMARTAANRPFPQRRIYYVF